MLAVVYIFAPIFPFWVQWLSISAVVFLIMQWFFKKDMYKTILSTLIVLGLLYMIYVRDKIEGFENEEKKKDDYIPNPELKTISLKEGKDWTQTLVKLPPTLRNVLKESLEKEGNRTYEVENKTKEEMTPAEAQRSTFYLIDTMKQLSSTLEHMKPVLEQGKEIMENLKMFPDMMMK
jgi:hypothetical protein